MIRGVVVKTIELAHDVKHSLEPTRREAEIPADAVIILANILRRVARISGLDPDAVNRLQSKAVELACCVIRSGL